MIEQLLEPPIPERERERERREGERGGGGRDPALFSCLLEGHAEGIQLYLEL